MGRNAQRRRAQRDAQREASGREVRSSLEERAGNRAGSGIRSVTGSDQVARPKRSKIDAAAATLAMATWGAVRR